MTGTDSGESAANSVVRNIGQRSLASQARGAILESIIGERFTDGRIPPEKDLAEMLGVSRTTVRAALQSLQDAGVIVRMRGRGTSVRPQARPSMLALHRLVGFTTMLRESGREPSVEAGWATLDRPPPDIADRLGIALDEPWYRMDKLFRADGNAAIFIENWCPVSYLSADVDQIDELLDWFELGDRYGRTRIDHAVVEIRAASADVDIARRLEIDPGTAILVLLETHYSARRDPLGYSAIWVNQDYVTFQVLREALPGLAA
jgi:GntR family transcriptional regulator